MRTKDFDDAIRWQVDDPVPSCKVLEYQPGNGSRYVIMFSKIPVAACEGIGCMQGSWMVSLADGACSGSCAIFGGSGCLDPSYVAEKLSSAFRVQDGDDVFVLTEIIGRVLGRKTPSAFDCEGYVARTQEE
jgi:hypothetical protein